jgi:hypothetical protein
LIQNKSQYKNNGNLLEKRINSQLKLLLKSNKNMKLKIAILPGDGIGPEIIEQAMKTVQP